MKQSNSFTVSIELTPLGGIKDSGLDYKDGVLEAMKPFCIGKTLTVTRA